MQDICHQATQITDGALVAKASYMRPNPVLHPLTFKLGVFLLKLTTPLVFLCIGFFFLLYGSPAAHSLRLSVRRILLSYGSPPGATQAGSPLPTW
jgi:hypothetical protein